MPQGPRAAAGVTHVVTEPSGVYTEPVYYALADLDSPRRIIEIRPDSHGDRCARSAGGWLAVSSRLCSASRSESVHS